ncbi:hypothetical protein HanHA300_Chr15g0559911 [Helianthus annuus]|nr:hypothetical protein HanHA300_Chr15g0559911 [Helianthus annuus]KAJ0455048.1 hypothetical protein HanIR_Chr15g0746801 [Helianthus annuus]KAJ0472619.1 hypothetical protein HanHA89_Chr15g0609081 [Helianthus annuus]KAJ0648222.1 hypothetical protein HanLR1_Chr15g0570461 [Helianthus annuus]
MDSPNSSPSIVNFYYKEFLADEGDSRVRKNRMTRKTKMTRSRKRRQKLRRVVLCVCVLLLM